MRRRGNFRQGGAIDSALRGVMLLCVFCALGILLGCFIAKHVSQTSLQQLRSYLTDYTELQLPKKDVASAVRVVYIYFRYGLLLLLFSFSSAGAYLVPVLCTWQSFTLSFTATVFARCISKGILLAISLLSLRCMFLFPTTLFCGYAAMQAAFGGGSRHSSVFWRCFGVSFAVLLLGAVLEMAVVPPVFLSICSN